MLTDKKNDLLYILNILESIEKIWTYSAESKSAEELYELNDQMNFNACLNLLANIGESIGKISDDLKLDNPNVEWRKIKDFRNKISHDYMGIDVFITFKVINENLKKLQNSLIEILSHRISMKILDLDEYLIAKESKYYKHIQFQEIDKKLST